MDPPIELPIKVLSVKRNYKARNDAELSVKSGTMVFLLQGGPANRQVLVRAITSPAKPQAQPGLVPWANLTTPDVWYRGQTLYAYHPQSQDCIQVDGGTKLNIYAFYVKWLLVGLEEEPGERAGLASVGFVDSNCIKGIDDGRQSELGDAGPVARRELPALHCSLCVGSVTRKFHFECTQCQFPEDRRFLVCWDCAYRRAACFIHQDINSISHSFARKTPSEGGTWDWYCDLCEKTIIRCRSFTCQLCPRSGKEFDLCESCFREPGAPRHGHRLITVSAEQILEKAPAPQIRESNEQYRCNGCQRLIAHVTVHCKTCVNLEFNLCTDCAEADRGTCMHEKWSAGGAPHDWEIVDRQPEARVMQRRVRNRAVSNRMAVD